MALLEVPVGQGDEVLLVEADDADVPADLVLATPVLGGATARATRTLGESLEQLGPLLRTVREKLAAAAPDSFEVEFGVKLGGETGIILARGTAEVNLVVTMTWDRRDGTG